MSKEYEGQDLKDIAAQAEQDINDRKHNVGVQDGTGFGGKSVGGGSTSTEESGIDQSVTNKFPGSTADYGSTVTGRTIPVEQGGDILKGTGQPTKAEDFDQGRAGEGPEDVDRRRAQEAGGDDEVRSNIRQHAPQKRSS